MVEPVPIYESSGLTLSDAAAKLGLDYKGLEYLGLGLIPRNKNLYKHQWDALETVLKEKKDLVVTTGTGSGKTECFYSLCLLNYPVNQNHGKNARVIKIDSGGGMTKIKRVYLNGNTHQGQKLSGHLFFIHLMLS